MQAPLASVARLSKPCRVCKGEKPLRRGFEKGQKAPFACAENDLF